jgi:hypothetical protein
VDAVALGEGGEREEGGAVADQDGALPERLRRKGTGIWSVRHLGSLVRCYRLVREPGSMRFLVRSDILRP